MNIKVGNVFESLLEPNSMVVHGCNAQGVMGSGVAAIVKNDFPAAFYEYRRKYDEEGLQLGEVIFSEVFPTRVIANAITQEFYGRDKKVYVDYAAIGRAFRTVKQFAMDNGISIINYPMIGAGLGGGDWELISNIIDCELEGLTHVCWQQ